MDDPKENLDKQNFDKKKSITHLNEKKNVRVTCLESPICR